jgi:hypothetical protein
MWVDGLNKKTNANVSNYCKDELNCPYLLKYMNVKFPGWCIGCLNYFLAFKKSFFRTCKIAGFTCIGKS